MLSCCAGLEGGIVFEDLTFMEVMDKAKAEDNMFFGLLYLLV